MTDTLQQQITDIITAWEDEAKLWEGWRPIPEIYGMARRRLPQLVALKAPDLVLENEIALVRKRIEQMHEHRMKAIH